MKILNLPLKKEWYEMIESGVKTEEYREIKPYWIKRLMAYKDGYKIPEFMLEVYSEHITNLKVLLSEDKLESIDFDSIKFSYGYTKRTMTFELERITIGKGRKEWGAPDNDVFIIKLGKRI